MILEDDSERKQRWKVSDLQDYRDGGNLHCPSSSSSSSFEGQLLSKEQQRNSKFTS